MSERTGPPMSGEIAGRVYFDDMGRFIHYCHCGQWTSFGYGVNLRKDQFGTWFCREHRPAKTEAGSGGSEAA